MLHYAFWELKLKAILQRVGFPCIIFELYVNKLGMVISYVFYPMFIIELIEPFDLANN